MELIILFVSQGIRFDTSGERNDVDDDDDDDDDDDYDDGYHYYGNLDREAVAVAVLRKRKCYTHPLRITNLAADVGCNKEVACGPL